MLYISEFIILFFLCCAIWLWYDIVSKRELAIYEGKRIANNLNLQFLDQTVHCTKISLVRTSSNWPAIKRIYLFNVSSNNDDRINCQLTIVGAKLIEWYVPPYPSNL